MNQAATAPAVAITLLTTGITPVAVGAVAVAAALASSVEVLAARDTAAFAEAGSCGRCTTTARVS